MIPIVLKRPPNRMTSKIMSEMLIVSEKLTDLLTIHWAYRIYKLYTVG
jgi:hypothetical protein